MNTIAYYRRRETQERELADRAQLPGIARIHREMAERYADLANRAEAPPRNRTLHLRA